MQAQVATMLGASRLNVAVDRKGMSTWASIPP
jgi:hypothetical protein